jgi:hypothetical protein
MIAGAIKGEFVTTADVVMADAGAAGEGQISEGVCIVGLSECEPHSDESLERQN